MPSQKKPPKEPKPERTQQEIDEWKRKKDEARKESEFKDQKSKTLKLNFDEETNWNYLFMN